MVTDASDETAISVPQSMLEQMQAQIAELQKQLKSSQAISAQVLPLEPPKVDAKRLLWIAQHLRTYGANNGEKQRGVSGWIHEALGGNWWANQEHPLWGPHGELQDGVASPNEVADALEEYAEHEGPTWTVVNKRGS